MSFLITNDRFILSILITLCISLSGCACSLVLTSNSSVGIKRSFLYMAFFVFVHESSTLLAFYTSSPDMFRLFVLLKSSSAYLIKSSLLLFTGFYTEKRWLKRLALSAHLLSIGQVLLIFLSSQWADTIISFTQPFEAQYQSNANWYVIVPGILFIVMSVGIMFHYKPLGRKSVANSVFVVLLLLSIVFLSVFYLSTRDMVFDNMHLIILLGAIAANLKAMPLTSNDTRYLSRTNVLDGFPEAVIIHDRKGRIVHIHDGIKTVKLSARLAEIEAKLMEAGALKDAHTLSEGRITIEDKSPVHLQYKVSTLQTGGKVFGRLIALRDVSKMVDLQLELSRKNRQLELAFAKRQQVARTIGQLAMEKERARILDKVNSIANAYISRIRRDVARLESEMAPGPDFHKKVREMNDQLLEFTRSVIGEIRATVKKLNPEPVASENLGDME
mgnify:CR=1 FL=1